MPRKLLATPLVVGTTTVVAILAAILMYLDSGRFLSLLISMLFLPVALLILMLVTRRIDDVNRASVIGGRLRAGLVGAGVLLATSLAFRVTDVLGWTGGESQLAGRSFIVFLPAIVAVSIDVLGARLEYEAEKDPDTEDP